MAPGGKESEPLKPSGGYDRGARRSGEQKIIPTGRAATTGARRRVLLFLRGRRGCSGAGRRLLTWSRPGSRRPAPLPLPLPLPPPHPWPRGPSVPRRVPGSASAQRSRPASMARAPGVTPGASCRSLPGCRDARYHLPGASVPGPQRPAEQAASRGSSASRGGGGSWASAERAAGCACAPPPPPPAGGLNHPPPRAGAAAGGPVGSAALTSSSVTQAPRCVLSGCFVSGLAMERPGDD